jgi:predicted  nucleic acid-binding Zn-ribbon protein
MLHPDLAKALHLQDLDLRILELKREIAALPKQIAEIERQLEGHVKRLEVDKAALAGNQRDRKKLDGDVQEHRQKISRLRDQMMQAKTNEQLYAFQHEVKFHEDEIKKSEDHILDMMLEAEKLEANVKIAEAALAEEKKLVDARKAETTARTAADKAELAKTTAERKATAAGLPPSLLQTYERLRVKMKGGVAIAEAVDGVCSACRLMMRPQHYADVRMGEQILTCENCRRLLYYNAPPQDVAAEMQA